MHHKRGKRKSRRGGCLWCKPHKHEAKRHMTSGLPIKERAARDDERRQRMEHDR